MARTSSPALTAHQCWWLLATALAAIAPLVAYLPWWLSLLAASGLCWRGWLTWRRRPLPPRWILVLLVIGCCVAVLARYRTIFGQNPGVSLLLLLICLKLLEARSVRDGLSVILLACFLALAQFFHSQTILAALATAVTTLTATAAMIVLVDPEPPPRTQLRRAALLLAQALPCMLVLFVLFPRVQGPLWGLPRDAASALTGLSDTMEPGAISRLSQSDDITFRVRFAGPVPPNRLLYWRGPVLNDFDGRTWRMERLFQRNTLPYEEPEEGGIEQEITLEAHGKPWLFALELPGHVPAGAQATREFQLVAGEAVTSRRRYHLRSYPELRPVEQESPALLERARRLPAGSNPRIRALAEGWRATSDNDEELLRRAQVFFLNQQLLYTLEPPALGEHAADEFLFDTRQGFCEHFAAAFTVVLRAAGLPARVVTGYQGGEVNPVDGYLAVHQYEAHAWTEVWLMGRGWLRVDPTAITVPTRIERSLAAAIPSSAALPLMARSDLAWLRQARFRWDALNNRWNHWVPGYTAERQRQVLRRLGMPSPDWRAMTATMAIMTAIPVAALSLRLLRRHRRRDPAAILWERLSRRLSPHGLRRNPTEGPLDWSERVAAALPRRAGDMRAMALLYCCLRYGPDSGERPRLLAELRRCVAGFRP